MEISKKEIRLKAITSGLVLGVILVAIMKILPAYIIANSTALSLVIPVPIIATFVVSPLIAAWFSFNLREKLGGYWAFRQAVTGIFFMFFAAFITFSISYYAFEKVAGPSINPKMKHNLVVVTSTSMEKQGVDQETIDAKVAEIEKQFEANPEISIGGMIQGLMFSIIMVFVFAVIFAAIFKKDPPVSAL